MVVIRHSYPVRYSPASQVDTFRLPPGHPTRNENADRNPFPVHGDNEASYYDPVSKKGYTSESPDKIVQGMRDERSPGRSPKKNQSPASRSPK